MHSTWSDGRGSIAQMADAARAMGLVYLGLSDHSKSAAYAGGLKEGEIARHDPEHLSFFNVNTPEDLIHMREMM